MRRAVITLVGAGTLRLAAAATEAEAPVGARPYELDWAGRTTDDAAPLVDFETPADWVVETRDAEARFERSRRQQIWGRWVGELTYRGGGRAPEVRIDLAPPRPVSNRFDAVQAWIYGNNWAYSRDPSTPPVAISLRFLDAAGEFEVPLATVNWKEWHLCRRRLEPAQIERTRNGVSFAGWTVRRGANTEDRTIWIDNIAAIEEEFPPLTFSDRPRRGIDPPPGGLRGVNTGEGRLPFPTRPETILPPAADPACRVEARRDGGAFVWVSDSRDGRIEWRYAPAGGGLDDLRVRCEGRGGEIRPCAGGGLRLAGPAGPVAPERAELRGLSFSNGVLDTEWRLSTGEIAVDARYRLRMWARSMVVDVIAPGGRIAEVAYGRAQGMADARLVTNPYYRLRGGHPAVVVGGPAAAPLFLTGHTDWYLSNATLLWAEPGLSAEGAAYNGGTRYVPRTDGIRNDCFERLFLTLSTRYEEMLPEIPNPVSPWKHVTGTRVWRAHGASDRDQDARYWRAVHRHGMTQLVVTDHETGWRDGGESFTFRTRPAPNKGGDDGQFRYARLMQDELGLLYGPYNNFTDSAPVNEFWTPDLIARTPENQLQTAWMRCYAPKPARAVEFCERLAPEIQRKFRFSTAYCDVHTCVAPWDRVDHDARVPGAATFAATFYAYGEIMLLQKQAWGGPVYSEGGHHAFYSGLTDGNYGQDQAYRPAENPWLVDFDLRRLHDLECNFGMGNPEMFYAARQSQPPRRYADDPGWPDRFLAATVAFGHSGFLVTEGGMGHALRSYHMLQQLHSRYCLARAEEIRYADETGRLLDTTAAVASGVHRRSQVVVRYADGTVVAANGHPAERLKARAHGRDLDLPPNGYAGWTADGAVEVRSDDAQGWRTDYAATPAYLYADGRGRFARFPRAASDGIGICRFLQNGAAEIIPVGGADCGFDVRASAATALDFDRREIGPAEIRRSRGLTYVAPVAGAFSYLLTPGPAPGAGPSSVRDAVVPGETVEVRGAATHRVSIPPDARPGQRIWRRFDDGWIDFTVVPLADASAALDGDALVLTLKSNAPESGEFRVAAGPHAARVRLEQRRQAEVRFDLGSPEREEDLFWPVEISGGALRGVVPVGIRVRRTIPSLAEIPAAFETGMQVRGGPETADFGATRGWVRRGVLRCGGIEETGLLMHPPYAGTTGCAWARSAAIRLPAEPAAFRASVGKGDGSDPGDGILYRVIVIGSGGEPREAARRTVARHAWEDIEADLSSWAGEEIRLHLIADPGPAGNASGDWAGWSRMRIESLAPVLRRELVQDPEALRTEAPPRPAGGADVERARPAARGRVWYEGQGLEGRGRYETRAVFNGIDLGPMTPAGGNEREGTWSGPAAVNLTPEAVRSLARRNRFEILNPNGDCFKIRRIWLELEFADGRAAASPVAVAVRSQPDGWPHAEGIRHRSNETIAVDLWLDDAP